MMKILREKFGYKTIVMIGDGMTDLESCPPAVSKFLLFYLISGSSDIQECFFTISRTLLLGLAVMWCVRLLKNRVAGLLPAFIISYLS